MARFLGPATFAEFMALWGIVFFVMAMLQGVQQEVVRSLAAGESRPPGESRTSAARRVLAVTSGALVCWVVMTLVADAAVSGPSMQIGLVLSLGLVFMLVLQVFNGLLAGSHMWGYYAASMSADAIGRALAVMATVAVGAGILGQSVAVALGGVAWIALAVRGRVRTALAQLTSLDFATVSRNARGALVATGASALVINAFPLLLQVAGDARGSAVAGVVIAAVVLTRAPLLMPLYAVQGMVIARFTRTSSSVFKPLTQITAATVAVTAVGAGLAALLGPAVMSLLFGDAYQVSGAFLAGLVVAAGLTAVLTLGGWAALARGRSRSYATGWAVTPAVMVLLLTLPLSLTTRASVALLVAPVVGGLVMLACARIERPRSGSAR